MSILFINIYISQSRNILHFSTETIIKEAEHIDFQIQLSLSENNELHLLFTNVRNSFAKYSAINMVTKAVITTQGKLCRNILFVEKINYCLYK